MTVAVVTGAGRGLGRGIATTLAAAGHELVLGWRNDEQALLETMSEVAAYGVKAVAVQGDVSDPETSSRLVGAATEELGGIDVWVNNAGVSMLARLVDTTAADLERMTAVNFFGTFYGLQAAARVMRGSDRPGRIINVASDLGVQAAPLLAGYSATKFAVVGLTQAAAVELAPFGISVNAVCPGTVETGMVVSEQEAEARLTGASVAEVRARLRADVPAGRFCTVADVSALVGFLASPGAEFVTGQSICTNGGSIRH
jgi:meso-butanediol dehydrogenase/(S,S)-butanediol dehydrogenase/diacetyl reductase